MQVIYFILVMVGCFVLMEGITWMTHKWIMHGFLWSLHRDHHEEEPHFFEKNDLFFLIFATPSFLSILIGGMKQIWWLQAAGFGILAYGLAYFIVHDVIIHQRFKWFSKSQHRYIRSIRWAHKMHHKHRSKENGESFGLLWVNKKYREKIQRDMEVRSADSRTAG